MALPYGNSNQQISLADATKFTANFRSSVPGSAVKSGAFDKAVISQILGQQGCEGIRCYYGLKDDGAPAVILVGIDSAGNDMVNGILGENWFPCPPFCDKAGSPLNT
ncbi:MAG: hypothetical protein EPO24_15425 [Bacteroidetes bacterium]|nr:MAG: hypothetical protein EPO24_15425 [Bacteroidota bacterium]